jgi:prepilin-type N-terminal cleavage/methylation domain-containing protein
MIVVTIKKNKGFTMVETLVAIFILLLSITGPLGIAQSGLRAAFLARDQTIAFYLAQDAIEYIKNIRDTNFIQTSGDWLFGLGECLNQNCTIDTTSAQNIGDTAIKSCNQRNSGCSFIDGYVPLLVRRIYGYDFLGFVGSGAMGEESKFYRMIRIDEVITNQEYQITVIVGWTAEDGNIKTVVSKENIFNWAPVYNIN